MSQSIAQFKLSENQRRIQAKCKILDRCSSSEDIFDLLRDEINTLANDESSDSFDVDDQHNFGVEYEIELLLEVISDLRWFTRYTRDEDNKSITENNLNYLRDYF